MREGEGEEEGVPYHIPNHIIFNARFHTFLQACSGLPGEVYHTVTVLKYLTKNIFI